MFSSIVRSKKTRPSTGTKPADSDKPKSASAANNRKRGGSWPVPDNDQTTTMRARLRFLGNVNGCQKARKMGACPQLRDSYLNRLRPALAIPVTIAIPLRSSRRILFAIGHAAHGAYLQLHKPLRGKANHLPEHGGISSALNKCP